MKIKIKGEDYEIQKLSSEDMFLCVLENKRTLSALCFEEEERELAEALSEHGALCSFVIRKNGERPFKTGMEALSALSADEVCMVRNCYLQVKEEEDEAV